MIASCELNRTAFFRRTRKGKVTRFVREKYQRTDVGYGVLHGNTLNQATLQAVVEESTNKILVVVDTNIMLHEIDILEQQSPVTALLLVTQTVLQELRHLNFAAFKRVRSLMEDESRNIIFFPNEASAEANHVRASNESVNDSNDHAIALAALVFHQSLQAPGKVVFVTNDAGNKKRAEALGVESYSMRAYLTAFAGDSNLLDFAASHPAPASITGAVDLYPEHLSQTELSEGIRLRKYHRGVLRCKRDDWTDCYVVVQDGPKGKGERARTVIQVMGKDYINRALDGDLVAVELTAAPGSAIAAAPATAASAADSSSAVQTEAEPTFLALEGLPDSTLYGKVVGIFRRNLRQYAGSIDAKSVQATDTGAIAAFRPVNRKLPSVLITSRRIDELLGQRVLVAIDSWPTSSVSPLGHYVRTFGVQGERAVENDVLLFELGVAHEAFSTAVLACLPPPDWQITEDLLVGRTDLRHLPISSVDPPGCKDIDDALHAIRLANGNLQVGVHIADVSHFVHPDSAMDQEAARRCTSTYLVERRLDMLPERLTTHLCSLRANEDHLTFSVLWEMDKDANILNVSFCKSIIHSKAALSYAAAQDILDACTTRKPSDDKEASLVELNRLARILRNRRIAAGALTLASPEVRFTLDQATQNPLDVGTYQLREANSMVEEWMLLANITVAKKTLQHFPTLSILRRHQPPSREQFAPLLQAAASVGVSLDISSSKALADSLDAAQREGDPFFNKLLRILSTRCMMPAQYFCSGELPKEDWHHYGLAAPVYTHFTSPIRRYADVLVHRLLAAAIGAAPLPTANADRIKQAEQSSTMNHKHHAAQLAQRSSVHLYTLIFFQGKVCEEDAYVLAVSEERVNVLVPRYGFEGALWADELRALGLQLTFLPATATMELRTSEGRLLRSLAIFDRIRVSITTLEDEGRERSLKMKLVIQ